MADTFRDSRGVDWPTPWEAVAADLMHRDNLVPSNRTLSPGTMEGWPAWEGAMFNALTIGAKAGHERQAARVRELEAALEKAREIARQMGEQGNEFALYDMAEDIEEVARRALFPDDRQGVEG